MQPDKSIKYATGTVVNAVRPASKIALVNKSKTYTGKAIAIGSATVTGSTGSVTYTYYTDSACTKKTIISGSGASATGKAPKYAGVYYALSLENSIAVTAGYCRQLR
ncbi:MAG: hypothetical protein KBS74_04665 [Clostridiales bacterium]|nr:hypothetical protein [Candidatus Cacconaster stercorequi]